MTNELTRDSPTATSIGSWPPSQARRESMARNSLNVEVGQALSAELVQWGAAVVTSR